MECPSIVNTTAILVARTSPCTEGQCEVPEDIQLLYSLVDIAKAICFPSEIMSAFNSECMVLPSNSLAYGTTYSQIASNGQFALIDAMKQPEKFHLGVSWFCKTWICSLVPLAKINPQPQSFKELATHLLKGFSVPTIFLEDPFNPKLYLPKGEDPIRDAIVLLITIIRMGLGLPNIPAQDSVLDTAEILMSISEKTKGLHLVPYEALCSLALARVRFLREPFSVHTHNRRSLLPYFFKEVVCDVGGTPTILFKMILNASDKTAPNKDISDPLFDFYNKPGTPPYKAMVIPGSITPEDLVDSNPFISDLFFSLRHLSCPNFRHHVISTFPIDLQATSLFLSRQIPEEFNIYAIFEFLIRHFGWREIMQSITNTALIQKRKRIAVPGYLFNENHQFDGVRKLYVSQEKKQQINNELMKLAQRYFRTSPTYELLRDCVLTASNRGNVHLTSHCFNSLEEEALYSCHGADREICVERRFSAAEQDADFQCKFQVMTELFRQGIVNVGEFDISSLEIAKFIGICKFEDLKCVARKALGYCESEKTSFDNVGSVYTKGGVDTHCLIAYEGNNREEVFDLVRNTLKYYDMGCSVPEVETDIPFGFALSAFFCYTVLDLWKNALPQYKKVENILVPQDADGNVEYGKIIVNEVPVFNATFVNEWINPYAANNSSTCYLLQAAAESTYKTGTTIPLLPNAQRFDAPESFIYYRELLEGRIPSEGSPFFLYGNQSVETMFMTRRNKAVQCNAKLQMRMVRFYEVSKPKLAMIMEQAKKSSPSPRRSPSGNTTADESRDSPVDEDLVPPESTFASFRRIISNVRATFSSLTQGPNTGLVRRQQARFSNESANENRNAMAVVNNRDAEGPVILGRLHSPARPFDSNHINNFNMRPVSEIERAVAAREEAVEAERMTEVLRGGGVYNGLLNDPEEEELVGLTRREIAESGPPPRPILRRRYSVPASVSDDGVRGLRLRRVSNRTRRSVKISVPRRMVHFRRNKKICFFDRNKMVDGLADRLSCLTEETVKGSEMSEGQVRQAHSSTRSVGARALTTDSHSSEASITGPNYVTEFEEAVAEIHPIVEQTAAASTFLFTGFTDNNDVVPIRFFCDLYVSCFEHQIQELNPIRYVATFLHNYAVRDLTPANSEYRDGMIRSACDHLVYNMCTHTNEIVNDAMKRKYGNDYSDMMGSFIFQHYGRSIEVFFMQHVLHICENNVDQFRFIPYRLLCLEGKELPDGLVYSPIPAGIEFDDFFDFYLDNTEESVLPGLESIEKMLPNEFGSISIPVPEFVTDPANERSPSPKNLPSSIDFASEDIAEMTSESLPELQWNLIPENSVNYKIDNPSYYTQDNLHGIVSAPSADDAAILVCGSLLENVIECTPELVKEPESTSFADSAVEIMLSDLSQTHIDMYPEEFQTPTAKEKDEDAPVYVPTSSARATADYNASTAIIPKESAEDVSVTPAFGRAMRSDRNKLDSTSLNNLFDAEFDAECAKGRMSRDSTVTFAAGESRSLPMPEAQLARSNSAQSYDLTPTKMPGHRLTFANPNADPNATYSPSLVGATPTVTRKVVAHTPAFGKMDNESIIGNIAQDSGDEESVHTPQNKSASSVYLDAVDSDCATPLTKASPPSGFFSTRLLSSAKKVVVKIKGIFSSTPSLDSSTKRPANRELWNTTVDAIDTEEKPRKRACVTPHPVKGTDRVRGGAIRPVDISTLPITEEASSIEKAIVSEDELENAGVSVNFAFTPKEDVECSPQPNVTVDDNIFTQQPPSVKLFDFSVPSPYESLHLVGERDSITSYCHLRDFTKLNDTPQPLRYSENSRNFFSEQFSVDLPSEVVESLRRAVCADTETQTQASSLPVTSDNNVAPNALSHPSTDTQSVVPCTFESSSSLQVEIASKSVKSSDSIATTITTDAIAENLRSTDSLTVVPPSVDACVPTTTLSVAPKKISFPLSLSKIPGYCTQKKAQSICQQNPIISQESSSVSSNLNDGDHAYTVNEEDAFSRIISHNSSTKIPKRDVITSSSFISVPQPSLPKAEPVATQSFDMEIYNTVSSIHQSVEVPESSKHSGDSMETVAAHEQSEHHLTLASDEVPVSALSPSSEFNVDSSDSNKVIEPIIASTKRKNGRKAPATPTSRSAVVLSEDEQDKKKSNDIPESSQKIENASTQEDIASVTVNASSTTAKPKRGARKVIATPIAQELQESFDEAKDNQHDTQQEVLVDAKPKRGRRTPATPAAVKKLLEVDEDVKENAEDIKEEDIVTVAKPKRAGRKAPATPIVKSIAEVSDDEDKDELKNEIPVNKTRKPRKVETMKSVEVSQVEEKAVVAKPKRGRKVAVTPPVEVVAEASPAVHTEKLEVPEVPVADTKLKRGRKTKVDLPTEISVEADSVAESTAVIAPRPKRARTVASSPAVVSVVIPDTPVGMKTRGKGKTNVSALKTIEEETSNKRPLEETTESHSDLVVPKPKRSRKTPVPASPAAPLSIDMKSVEVETPLKAKRGRKPSTDVSKFSLADIVSESEEVSTSQIRKRQRKEDSDSTTPNPAIPLPKRGRKAAATVLTPIIEEDKPSEESIEKPEETLNPVTIDEPKVAPKRRGRTPKTPAVAIIEPVVNTTEEEPAVTRPRRGKKAA